MEINVSLLFAMSYEPRNKIMRVNGRPQHTFLYISNGEYRYTFNKETFTAKSGDLVYVPKGAVYSYEVTSENTYCHQVEFALESSDFPVTLCPQKIIGIDNAEKNLKEIIENYDVNNTTKHLRALGTLYTLCSYIPLKQKKSSEVDSRISAAVEYIESHCAKKIDIQTLADLCFMSQSQLRRYFIREYKMSPITYKNRYRIEKAKSMLLYDVADIGEISAKLGFDSIYSFSKIFKQYAGITPTQFAKNKSNS